MILSILKISCKGCKTQKMELAASPIGRILGLPAQAAAGEEAQTMMGATPVPRVLNYFSASRTFSAPTPLSSVPTRTQAKKPATTPFSMFSGPSRRSVSADGLCDWQIANAPRHLIGNDKSASVQRSSDRWVETDFKWRDEGSAGND
jgi:hypothetical protein